MNKRIRDYELIPGTLPTGPGNLISDVAGVTVGHVTKKEGDDTRTGVTIINPSPNNIFRNKLSAAVAVGNGYGKMTGTTQIAEIGVLETPIALTNTLAVGPVMRGVVDLVVANTPDIQPCESINAVVGETNDWIVNRLHANVVTGADVAAAFKNASADFELGAVGAGTGTRAFSWKGGIGSASRQVEINEKTITVGALVQTNFGGDLTIIGKPVGRLLGAQESYTFTGNEKPDGSCMIVIATDAALTSRQLGRLARRAFLALARTGSVMADSSGDYALAFSTADPAKADDATDGAWLNPLFLAVVEAVEESIYDALFCAETVTGRDGNSLQAFPAQTAAAILRER